MRYDYAYDCMGRLTSKSASGRKLLAYTYDLNGNRSTMTDVTGKCTGYRYNSLDQLLEITDNGKVQARYDYNGDGTIRRLEVGTSLVTEYAYDVDKNLISQKTMMMGMEGGNSPLGTLQGLGNQTFSASSPLKNVVLVDNTYAYDSNANRIEKRTLAGLNRFAYDSVNRLVKAEYPTGAEEYRYDKAGNRTAKVWTGTEPGKRREESYHYDSCNRLTRQDILPEDRNQPQQIKCFYYDNQGNMLADGNRQFVYDAMNRLSEVKNTDGTHQKNHYDGEGLRAELEENGRLVSFIFDGDRVVSEKDDENTIRYIRGYELISSDSEKARTYYHYTCDEMGSITHVTDEAGSILNRYEYDAFGDCTYKDETVANRFGFAGEQFDPVAGMYYLRTRFYNPVIGRFIQEDTYYGDGLNLYAYCHNNPVGYVDSSGHCNEKYEAIKYLKKTTEGLTTQEALERYKQYQKANPNLSPQELKNKIMGEGSRKTDFYVTPEGVVIPQSMYHPPEKVIMGEIGTSTNLTIMSRNSGMGNPGAITHFGVELNNRQSKLLSQLDGYDSSVLVNKSDVNLKDLAALTAKTGDEFAMFTRGSQRLIIRGGPTNVNIDAQRAQALYNAGYKWSGHTHPGIGFNVKMPSEGDMFILEQFNQSQSVIYDSNGQFNIFGGD